MRTATIFALLGALSSVACAREKIGTVEGPPLTIARPDASAAGTAPASEAPGPVAAESAAPAASAPAYEKPTRRLPVIAELVTVFAKSPLKPSPVPSHIDLEFTACEQITVAVITGRATVAGERLEKGDVLVAHGAGSFQLLPAEKDLTVEAVVARVQPPNCEPNNAKTITKKVVRAKTAPELTWAGGQMHAHLDVGPDVSPNAYVGRLEGTAAVAEHTHPDSWEILCTIEAAGTFTLDGKEQRLGPREIVRVPPGARHSWKPDPGSKLSAVQMYAPPGPEQRFKALADAEKNAPDPGKRH